MKIALWEPYPLMEARLFALLKKAGLDGDVSLERPKAKGRYDLVLFEGGHFPEDPHFQGNIWLVPSSACVKKLPEGVFLTGGMSPEDDVSLSSIGEDDALLYTKREILQNGRPLFPFEKRIPYDRNFTLYKNLAAGFGLLTAKFYFGEDV